MGIEITEITHQPLSSLVGDFYRCLTCNKVDRDHDRARKGYPCPYCGLPSEGARVYFPLTALSLIDLVQGFYHLKGDRSMQSPLYDPSTNPRLATVIFFCSLGEVLLTHLLKEIMLSQGVIEEKQQKLLTDNLTVKRRVETLYPQLTRQQWTSDLNRISRKKELDYLVTHKFFLKVTEARNLWLHQGNVWAIKQDMSKHCVEALWPLVCMFVALHNVHAATS